MVQLLQVLQRLRFLFQEGQRLIPRTARTVSAGREPAKWQISKRSYFDLSIKQTIQVIQNYRLRPEIQHKSLLFLYWSTWRTPATSVRITFRIQLQWQVFSTGGLLEGNSPIICGGKWSWVDRRGMLCARLRHSSSKNEYLAWADTSLVINNPL